MIKRTTTSQSLLNQRNRSDAEIGYLRYNVCIAYIAYIEAFPNGNTEYTHTRRDR